MEIRNNTNNLAFQARLTPQLKGILRDYASQKGEKTQKLLRDKISQVATWGRKDSEISAYSDVAFDNYKGTTLSESLDLQNPSISKNWIHTLAQSVRPLDGVNNAKNLFKNFIQLTEDDIVKAENSLMNSVFETKVSLLTKAIEDSKITKEILGKTEAKPDEIWQGIKELPEEKIIGLQAGSADIKADILDDTVEWII